MVPTAPSAPAAKTRPLMDTVPSVTSTTASHKQGRVGRALLVFYTQIQKVRAHLLLLAAIISIPHMVLRYGITQVSHV